MERPNLSIPSKDREITTQKQTVFNPNINPKLLNTDDHYRIANFCSTESSWALMVQRTQRELLTAGHYTHKEPAFYLKALPGLTWRFYGCRKDRRQCSSRLYKKSVGSLAMSRSRRHSLHRARKSRRQPSSFTSKDPWFTLPQSSSLNRRAGLTHHSPPHQRLSQQLLQISATHSHPCSKRGSAT